MFSSSMLYRGGGVIPRGKIEDEEGWKNPQGQWFEAEAQGRAAIPPSLPPTHDTQIQWAVVNGCNVC